MKKLLRSILIAFTALVLVALPVLAITYTSYILLSETSGNNYVQTPFILSQNNTYLSSQGFFSSVNGTDVRITDAGSDLKFMLADNKTLFCDNLSANTVKTLEQTFGNSPPLSSFPIITGQGGYVTTADNGSLEFGDNSTIVVSGYINTDSGASKSLVNKTAAINISVSPTNSQNITATVYTQPTYNIVQTANDTDNFIYNAAGTNYEGERFDSFPISTITSVKFLIAKLGSPTDIASAQVRTVAGDALLGTLGVYDTATLGTTPTWITFNTTPYVNTSVQNIRVVLFYGAGTYPAEAVNMQIQSTDVLANAQRAYKFAGTWTDSTGDVAIQLTYSPLVTTTISKAGITSGNHTVAVGLVSSVLSLTINGSAVTASCNGSVVDNSNNWTFCSANTTPYVSYVTENVSAGQVLWYQPTGIISTTVLPNRASGGDYGVITWGANPAGTSTSVNMPTPSVTPLPTPTAVNAPNIVMPSTGQNPAAIGTGTTGSTFWFYGLFKGLLDQYNSLGPGGGPNPHPITIQWFWMVVAFVVTVGAGIMAIKMGSALLLVVAMCGGVAMFCSATVFSWWVFYVTVLILGTLLIWQRVHSVGG